MNYAIYATKSTIHYVHTGKEKNLLDVSICACHPCVGAILISISFQFYRILAPAARADGGVIGYTRTLFKRYAHDLHKRV